MQKRKLHTAIESIRQRILNDKLFRESFVDNIKQNWDRIIASLRKPANLLEEKKKQYISAKWFREKIRNYKSGVYDEEIYGKNSYAGMTVRGFNVNYLGQICIFHYDAKYREVLPIWDRYPLSLIYNEDRLHYYGLNFHYVPPIIRFTILESLVNEVRFLPNDKAYFVATYEKMKKLQTIRYMKPCFKTYLKNRMTPPKIIKPLYWFNAIYLPKAEWVIKNYGV